MAVGTEFTETESWDVQRRADGAVLVRVPSRANNGHTLPDAVFAFRVGDPQYLYWEQRLQSKQSLSQ